MAGGAAPTPALCRPYLEIEGVEGAVVLMIGTSLPPEAVAAIGDSRRAELEIDLGEGPSWLAVREGEPVLVVDTSQVDERWPVLSASLAGLAPACLVAAPLTFAGITIGAVEIAFPKDSASAARSIPSVRELAGPSALALMALAIGDAGLERSQNPNSRRVVWQATGMILHAFGVSVSDAAILLRAHAFTLGRAVHDVASDIVGRRSTFLDPPSNSGSSHG